MTLIYSDTGEKMTDAEAQEKIRQTIARFGRFILNSDTEPMIGEVCRWAGLPLRVVRFVSYEEAKAEECIDIWKPVSELEEDVDLTGFYFEVEVAD